MKNSLMGNYINYRVNCHKTKKKAKSLKEYSKADKELKEKNGKDKPNKKSDSV